MISLEKVRACMDCRLVLPADGDDPDAASFWPLRRDGERALEWEEACKKCMRRRFGNKKTYHRPYFDVRDGLPVRLKVCRGCGEAKRVEVGPDSEFALHGRKKTGTPVWNPKCKVCVNEAFREHVQADPKFAAHIRAQGRRLNQRWLEDPANREKARAATRRYQRRLKLDDPERYLDYSRMSYVLRQEKRGKVVRHRSTVVDHTKPRIPAAPFREYLEAYARIDRLNGEELARDLGLTVRRVHSVLLGEYEQVEVDVVSRALTNARYVVNLPNRAVITIDDLYEGVL